VDEAIGQPLDFAVASRQFGLRLRQGRTANQENVMNRIHRRSIGGSGATTLVFGLILGGQALVPVTMAHASDVEDRQIVAALDTKYQQAVEQNDAKTMAELLADNFTLVEGNGKRSTKADLINAAKSGKTHYDHQEDSQRTIVVSGDTAVVTAMLWAKGIEDGVKVNYKQWFTDVYVRTPKGWRYFYAQASLALPEISKK
jgi:ketosteroid isomerase-like protein